MDSSHLILLLMFITSLSCGPHQGKEKSEVRAEPQVSQSFLTSAGADGPRSTRRIAILKSALEKEFLLQGSLVFSLPVSMFNGLKSRVVAFREYDDALYMLETKNGHVVTSDIKADLILAKFPIIERSEQAIYFDFNQGMSKLFVAEDWRALDYQYPEGFDWISQDIGVSYIESAELNNKNQLVIKQVAQIHQQKKESSVETPVEIVYYLSPYEGNSLFNPTENIDFDRMGYFAVAPRFKDDDSQIEHGLATKFDHNKGIIYGISANTPEPYKQAVRDGILYWNKAFGKKVIEVIDLPVGISAPNFNHNIVQWVDWDDASSAYADAQMDPRTGEVLHAQVFLSSTFAFSSQMKARELLRRLKTESAKKNHIGVRHLGTNHLCDLDINEHLSKTLESILLAPNVEANKMLKLSQDVVRSVVAHEIGHTLGLRHNFAGSLAANYARADRNKNIASYIKSGSAPLGLVVSSSVMDYMQMEEDMLVGDQVAKLSRALAYDEKAIGHLYFGKKYKTSDIPLFCTDSHVGQYLDCQRFDVGANYAEELLYSSKEFLENIPFMLLHSFLDIKSIGKSDLPLKAGAFNPAYAALVTIKPRFLALRALKSDVKMLSVEREHSYVSEVEKNDLQVEQRSFIQNQFKNAGGMAAFFAAIKEEDLKALEKKFGELVQGGAYDKGVGIGGNYRLTESDKKVMLAQAQKFFEQFGQALTRIEIQSLAQVQGLEPGELTFELEEIFGTKIREIVFSSSETNNVSQQDQEGNIKVMQLPVFKHPFKTRLIATQILSNKSTEFTFGVIQKVILYAQFSAYLDQISGTEFDKIKTLPDYLFLPRDARQWVEENALIKLALAR